MPRSLEEGAPMPALPMPPSKVENLQQLDQYGFWWNRGAIRQSHEIDRENKRGAG